MERRDFLAKSGAALAGLGAVQGKTPPRKRPWPIVAFEKPFQALDYDRMGEELAKMGAQGIEATIRKGGHIEQKNAAREVPEMVKALAKNDQKALLVASNISEITPENETFLQILKAHGITRYRMGYFRYDLNGDMLQQVRGFKVKAEELAAYNRENGFQGIYQLHSGSKFLGGLSWDLGLLLEEIDPSEIGIGFDLRHFRTDAGLSWKAALQVARKHIRAIYVKDAVWAGKRSDQLKSVPLDSGFVNQEIFDEVRKGQKAMPLSVHMEWGIAPIYPKGRVMEAVEKMAREVKTLRSWL